MNKKARLPLPEQQKLSQYLRYDPETGVLYWQENEHVGRRRHAGKAVYVKANTRGYLQIELFGKRYVAHRIIWRLMTGDEPIEIDHINGDVADNRFSNLRSVSSVENNLNLARSSRNKSGCTGVNWQKATKCWQVHIQVDGVQRYLGCFKSKDEAIRVRKAEERRLGFHPNHGRAAHPTGRISGTGKESK